MALSSNLVTDVTLTAGSTNPSTYNEISRDASGVIRSRAGAPLSAPHTMTVRHTMQKSNSKVTPQVDRHNIVISGSDPVDTSGDSFPDVLANVTVSVAMTVDRNHPTAQAVIIDSLRRVVKLMTDNGANILAGES